MCDLHHSIAVGLNHLIAVSAFRRVFRPRAPLIVVAATKPLDCSLCEVRLSDCSWSAALNQQKTAPWLFRRFTTGKSIADLDQGILSGHQGTVVPRGRSAVRQRPAARRAESFGRRRPTAALRRVDLSVGRAAGAAGRANPQIRVSYEAGEYTDGHWPQALRRAEIERVKTR
jgi:hypothetical protein